MGTGRGGGGEAARGTRGTTIRGTTARDAARERGDAGDGAMGAGWDPVSFERVRAMRRALHANDFDGVRREFEALLEHGAGEFGCVESERVRCGSRAGTGGCAEYRGVYARGEPGAVFSHAYGG